MTGDVTGRSLGEVMTDVRDHLLQLDGVEIGHLPAFRRVRAGISFVPSGSRAFPNLTVHENLAMVRGGANSGRGEWTIQRVYEAFPQLAALRASSGGTLFGLREDAPYEQYRIDTALPNVKDPVVAPRAQFAGPATAYGLSEASGSFANDWNFIAPPQ